MSPGLYERSEPEFQYTTRRTAEIRLEFHAKPSARRRRRLLTPSSDHQCQPGCGSGTQHRDDSILVHCHSQMFGLQIRGVSFQLAIHQEKHTASRILTPLFDSDKSPEQFPYCRKHDWLVAATKLQPKSIIRGHESAKFAVTAWPCCIAKRQGYHLIPVQITDCSENSKPPDTAEPDIDNRS